MKENREINILMVDDHPMIFRGYQDVIEHHLTENFCIDTAEDCDTAWDKITATNYDLLFLDMSFPYDENKRFVSGEDFGARVKEEYPKIKIIVLTQIEDAFHLRNIMTNIDPEGFLLKREARPEVLAKCIRNVIDSTPFYSPRISRILQAGTATDFVITKTDRLILHELSLGTKTKDLDKYIPLSFRTLENRKRRLKEYFGVDDDRTLLAKAREEGYI